MNMYKQSYYDDVLTTGGQKLGQAASSLLTKENNRLCMNNECRNVAVTADDLLAILNEIEKPVWFSRQRLKLAHHDSGRRVCCCTDLSRENYCEIGQNQAATLRYDIALII